MKHVACRFSLLLLIGFSTLFTTKALAQENAIEQYIQKYKNIAEEEMQRTGVPAAISLAQGIIESQAGQGWLVEHSHNHFGIKCKADWTGPTILFNDDHKNECFRVYATDDSSWRDHSDFLKYSPRYAFLFQLDPLDYKAWAYGLKEAGYATSKTYAHKLIRYIEQYHLQQYSEHVLAGETGQSIHTFAGMLEKKIQEDRIKNGLHEANPTPVATATDNGSHYPAGRFTLNGLDVVFLPGGSQLIATADKYHIRLARLLRYNELKNDVLEQGSLIYLQKKKKTGAHKVHVVADNESMGQIAAAEGIRLKWLYKWNHLSAGDRIAPGEVLYLQGYKPESKLAVEPSKEHHGFFYKLAHLFFGNKEQVVYYQVKSGDTLYSLSRKYNATVDQIKQWNDLQSDRLQTGQQLILKQ